MNSREKLNGSSERKHNMTTSNQIKAMGGAAFISLTLHCAELLNELCEEFL